MNTWISWYILIFSHIHSSNAQVSSYLLSWSKFSVYKQVSRWEKTTYQMLMVPYIYNGSISRRWKLFLLENIWSISFLHSIWYQCPINCLVISSREWINRVVAPLYISVKQLSEKIKTYLGVTNSVNLWLKLISFGQLLPMQGWRRDINVWNFSQL